MFRGLCAPTLRRSSDLVRSHKLPCQAAGRCFHASSSALKKKGSSTTQNVKAKPSKSMQEQDPEEEYEEDEEDDDLFSDNISPSSSSVAANQDLSSASIHRAQKIQDIIYDSQIKSKSMAGLTPSQTRSLRKSMEYRTENGTLRNIVHLTRTGQDAEDLKSVLRYWRVLGRHVSKRVAQEIIARCRKAGRPDVALEIMSDPVQYGLPSIPSAAIIKLYGSFRGYSKSLGDEKRTTLPTISSSSRMSPSIALLWLDLQRRVSTSSGEGGDEETESLQGVIDRLANAVQPGWRYFSEHPARKASVLRLQEAGGVWKEGCERILGMETGPSVAAPSNIA